MDTTTIISIVAVLAVVAFYFYNRSKPAPRGTYDNKNVRSSGSIGGGTRANDDATVRSSGSIGGGTRANDSAAHTSGGSIGGRQQTENSSSHTATNREPQPRVMAKEPPIANPGSEHALRPLNDETTSSTDQPLDRIQERKRTAEQEKPKDEFRSGGSFGGSRG